MITLSCDLNFGWFVEAEFWRGSPPLYWWSRHNKPLSARAISKGLSGTFWIVRNLRLEGGGWFMVANHPSKITYLAIWLHRLVYVWANMGKVDGYWAEFWVFYEVDGMVQGGGGLHIGISFVAARWAIQRKWVYSSLIYVVTSQQAKIAMCQLEKIGWLSLNFKFKTSSVALYSVVCVWVCEASVSLADFPAVFFHISHWYLSWNTTDKSKS